MSTAMKPGEAEDLAKDFERRGASCRSLARDASDEARARLMGKAYAYDHCAELLRALSHPASEADQDVGGGA